MTTRTAESYREEGQLHTAICEIERDLKFFSRTPEQFAANTARLETACKALTAYREQNLRLVEWTCAGPLYAAR